LLLEVDADSLWLSEVDRLELVELLTELDSLGFKLGFLLMLSLKDCEADRERLLTSERLVLAEIETELLKERLVETEVELDWLRDRLRELFSLRLVEID